MREVTLRHSNIGTTSRCIRPPLPRGRPLRCSLCFRRVQLVVSPLRAAWMRAPWEFDKMGDV